MTEDLWALEERCWNGPLRDFLDRLEDCSIMVTPERGILRGAALRDAMTHAPRWDSVTLSDRVHCMVGDVCTLAYTIRVLRGADARMMQCSSAWRQRDGKWIILLHQQAPLPAHRADQTRAPR